MSAHEDQPAAPLPASRLYRPTDAAALGFQTTAELSPLPGLIDQPRAREAINLGTCINRPGFNIFAAGSGPAHIRHALQGLLHDSAFDRPTPSDWVYVNNFIEPHRPVAIPLPGGRAQALAKAMAGLVDDLKVSLPTIFEGEDYQKRKAAIEQSIQGRGQQAFAALNEKATAQGIAILRTPMGFAMAPMREGKVVEPAVFNAWPEADRKAVSDAIEILEKELEETLRAFPRLEKEVREAVRALERETAQFALAEPINELRTAFADLPAVLTFIEAINTDLMENVHLFSGQDIQGDNPMMAAMRLSGALERYAVNVLVAQPDSGGAPVVEELNPTLGNLVGRIEYLQTQGALVTNFRLIKPGALHRANGGTLLLDARALLTEPFSWAALKRALSRGQITIEDAGRFMGMASTVSLEPDPIPLNVKIVLYGDRSLYFMLAQADPDLATYFKVLADFDDDTERSVDGEMMLARVIAAITKRDGLKPLDRDATACVIEQAARLADDSGRLSLVSERLRDIVIEADHWAHQATRDVITRQDIERAITQHRHRGERIQIRGQDMILNEIALVSTEGSAVGQINGLSVMSLPGHAFGRPTRITCRVRPGSGKIMDIEREVELGGPLHSKGVLILSGFLGGRYALDSPMSLYASLVFEQSYGGVDGDSASSAELYTLLSALSDMPLRQDLACTGSVNQLGLVQAIGGVNEKIEGFFDICSARGLTGTQGVMIPASNTRHLMLRADVVEACATGRFAIYPITSIDQGIALLTSTQAGTRGTDGLYPEASINRLVEDRLRHFSDLRKKADPRADIT